MASLAERGQAAFAWCLPSQKGVTEHGRGQRKKWSARETRRGKGEGSCVSTVRPRGSEGGCAEHCDPEQGCRWLLVSCLQLHQVDHDPPQRDRKEGRPMGPSRVAKIMLPSQALGLLTDRNDRRPDGNFRQGFAGACAAVQESKNKKQFPCLLPARAFLGPNVEQWWAVGLWAGQEA